MNSQAQEVITNVKQPAITVRMQKEEEREKVFSRLVGRDRSRRRSSPVPTRWAGQATVCAVSCHPAHIAVVGAGPTGMSAAYDLVRRGYRVTLLDGLPIVGGMLAIGIPRDLVPERELTRDARLLSRLGVDIRLRMRLGHDLSLAALRQQVDVVLLTIGSQQDTWLHIPGERELVGVVPALTFLKQHNLGRKKIPLAGDIVVIGSGRKAVFAARTAMRAGASSVHVITPGPLAWMAVAPATLSAARQEGVQFHEWLAPLALLGYPGTVPSVAGSAVQAVRCQYMQMSAPTGAGRYALRPVTGAQYRLPADHVIIAAGPVPPNGSGEEAADIALFPFSSSSPDSSMQIPHTAGTMIAGRPKHYSYATNMPDVFVAGGMLFGPGTVALALSEGQRVAHVIHSMLQRKPEEELDPLPADELHLASLHLEDTLSQARKGPYI